MKRIYTRCCVILFACLFFAFEGKALTVTIINSTPVTCFAVCNGTATCQANGGTGPYSYLWTPSGATMATVTNLCPGTHIVTVTDATSATATATVTITQPPPITITMSTTSTSCNNFCNGTATGTPVGGVPPYTYMWSPSGGTTPTASGLCAGAYTITVTDSYGCTASNATQITQPTGLTVNAGIDQSICYGGSATLTGTVSGGVAPYTYLWQASSYTATTQTATASPTITTTYTLTVTDANGCTGTDMVIVTPSQILSLSFSSYNATCNQANGAISVSPSGGAAPYTYLWANSTTNDTNINLPAGLHAVTVTDANGCTNTGSGAISNSTGPVLSISSSTNPNCYNATNGSATVNVTGSPQAYTYLWNTTPPQTTATVSNSGAGIYYCTVSDTNNCQSSISVTFVQPPQLYLGAQVLSGSNCTNNGSASAWASGGVAPYNFVWSNSMTGDTVNGLSAGSFSVIVTDNMGCTATGSVTITTINATLVEGRVYNDMNANCVFDAGDVPLPNQVVYIYPYYNYCITDAAGNYHFYSALPGSYNVVVAYSYAAPYVTGFCPANNILPINIASLCDTVSGVDFSRTVIPGMQDLRITMGLQHINPRPGFNETVYLYYWNVGTVAVPNATIDLVYDSIMGFVSSSQTPSINNQAHLEWNMGTVQPGQSGIVTATLLCPTIQNGGYLGRPLNFFTSINPTSGEQTPLDNVDNELHHIIGSWDPNEKSCYAAGMDSAGNITTADSILSYTIHFQNTGTDTAFNVYVEDTLSQYLDPATITPGASSHPYTMQLSGSGLVRFNFYNILLPDSNHNEPLSNGFVEFTIKTKPGLLPGTTIENTAFIYFDFNPAVVTNTTSNTIILNSPLSIPQNDLKEISAYPNPFDQSVTLTVPANYQNKNCEVVLTDVEGRIVTAQQKQNGNSIIIQRGQLDAGIYFCTIRCEGELIGNKKLIIK